MLYFHQQGLKATTDTFCSLCSVDRHPLLGHQPWGMWPGSAAAALCDAALCQLLHRGQRSVTSRLTQSGLWCQEVQCITQGAESERGISVFRVSLLSNGPWSDPNNRTKHFQYLNPNGRCFIPMWILDLLGILVRSAWDALRSVTGRQAVGTELRRIVWKLILSCEFMQCSLSVTFQHSEERVAMS